MLITCERRICIICGSLAGSYYCRECEQKDWPEPPAASTEDKDIVKRSKLAPLVQSVMNGKWKEVEALLAQKADPLTKDPTGNLIVYHAIAKENENIMKVFLEKAPGALMHQNPELKGANCLHLACEQENLKVCRLLP
jgi:ankyrin repeat protein